jgi:hypothetical protein
MKTKLWLGLMAAVLASPASGNVIYTNFGPGLSYNTGAGNPLGNAFDGNNYAQGLVFTPSAGALFDRLEIALSCPFLCPPAGAVTIALTIDAGGVPGMVLESFSIPGSALGLLGVNNPPHVVTSVLHPMLDGGSPYWVTLAASINDSVAWNLNSTGSVSSGAISSDGGAAWFAPSGLTPGALQVESPIPEPSTLTLLGAGLLLLAYSVRLIRGQATQSPIS